MLVGIPLWEPSALVPIEFDLPAASAAWSCDASDTFSAAGVLRPGYLWACGWSPVMPFSGACAIDAAVAFAPLMLSFLGVPGCTGAFILPNSLLRCPVVESTGRNTVLSIQDRRRT